MGSIRLLTIRGIPIRIHITFPLILVWAAFQYGQGQADWVKGALFGVAFTLLLFIGVLLHELAHSLVALRFGARVREIVLFPLGGVAQMESLPEQPWQELLMALAGPATSAVVGGALGVLTLFFFPLRLWLGFFRALGTGLGLRWGYLLPYLAFTNLLLAGFNLIPAFPMDGGRVLRALLATAMPYGRATAIAVAVGQGLAWLLGLIGLLGGDVVLILVAFLVYTGASQEGRMVQMKLALAGLRVGQVFSRGVQAVSSSDPLGTAVDMMLEGFQADFPVCEEGRLVGLVTRADLLRALKEYGPNAPVGRVMRREFPTVTPEDDLFEVHERMTSAGLEAVPVVEEGQFLGLLTRQDLNEAYALVSVRPGLLRPRV